MSALRGRLCNRHLADVGVSANEKNNAALFSSNDPNTPMKRAFLAHTLMRKDHDEHRTERMAMMPALMPKTIESVWAPLYAKLAAAYLDRLPRGEVVDLFPALAGPLAARMLAHAMGVPDASDEDMQRWSQTLIDGAGNFGWTPGPFQATDIANAEMDKCIRAASVRWHGFGFRGPLNLPLQLQ